MTWDVPTGVKFVLVFLATAGASYLLSQYLIRAASRLAVAGLVGVHVALLVFGLPRSSYSHVLLDRQEQLQVAVAGLPLQVVEALPDELDLWAFGSTSTGAMALRVWRKW